MARALSRIFNGFPADLEGPIAKIDRAEHHLIDFRDTTTRQISAWLESKPYTTRLDRKPNGSEQVCHRFDNCYEAPVDVRIILGEVLYHLSSSLDHLISALALRNGLQVPGQYFPCRKSSQEFDTAVAEIRGLDAATRKTIKELQAYQGGDRFLWPIRQLDNINKHRALSTITCVGSTRITIFGVLVGHTGTTVLKPGEEIRFAKHLMGAKPYIDSRLALEVSFDEPDIWPSPEGVMQFMVAAIARFRSIIGLFK